MKQIGGLNMFKSIKLCSTYLLSNEASLACQEPPMVAPDRLGKKAPMSLCFEPEL
jgi:hypothetical protein